MNLIMGNLCYLIKTRETSPEKIPIYEVKSVRGKLPLGELVWSKQNNNYEYAPTAKRISIPELTEILKHMINVKKDADYALSLQVQNKTV